MYASIRLRRDTFKNFWTANPFLSLGEVVLIFRESNNGKGTAEIDSTSKCIGYAIGDGIHYFRDLDVFVNNAVTKTTGDISLGTKVVDCYSVTDDAATYKQLTGDVTVTSSDYLFATAGIGGTASGGTSKNYFTNLYLVTENQMSAAADAEDYSEVESLGYCLKLTAGDTPSENVVLTAKKEGNVNMLDVATTNMKLAGSLTVAGDEYVGGKQEVSGTTTLKSTLAVTSSANIGTALSVGGNQTVTGNIIANGTVQAGGTTNYVKLTGSATGSNIAFKTGSATASLTYASSKITSTADLYRS